MFDDTKDYVKNAQSVRDSP